MYIEQINGLWGLIGYNPTESQRAIHYDQARNKLVSGGERGGKSKTNEIELLDHWFVDTLPFKKAGLYWLLGSDYEACRGEWEHLLLDLAKLEQIQEVTKNIDPALLVLKDGTRIVTKSAKYPEKIATVAPDGILLCEAAQLDYEIYLRARGRVAEKRGWVSMAGTFEEEENVGWYRELYELGQGYNELELKSFSLPTWSNTAIFPLGRDDPELRKLELTMPADRFMERYGGVPCPHSDRVIPEFSNQIHIHDCPFNKDVPVELAIDVGYGGAYCVLACQEHGEQMAIIDEIYLTKYVSEEIIMIAQKKPWWRYVQGGAIDIAGTQHQGMTSPVEVWASVGHVSLVYRRVNLWDGIDVLRTQMKLNPITGKAGIMIDPKCVGLISELGGGRSPVEGGGVWLKDKNTGQPKKMNDHACKALIYLLVNKYVPTPKGERVYFPRWVGEPAKPTFVKT